MALLLLLAVIGAIVYFSRKGRATYILRLSAGHPNRIRELNVRDMSAKLLQLNPLKTLESYELRRFEDGTWEQAVADAGDESDAASWSPCEGWVRISLEDKYRNYNGMPAQGDR